VGATDERFDPEITTLKQASSHFVRLFLYCGLLFSSVACSSGTPLYPVEGKVLHKGKELSKVVVTFHPKDGDPIRAQRPTGLTGDDGSFKLSTGKDPGVAPGEYLVTFAWLKEIPSKEKKGMSMGPNTETVDGFAGAFADPSKSKHKITIHRASTKLEPFQLD